MKKSWYWSPEEGRVLTEYYGVASLSELVELLPGRTYAAVRSKIKYVGLREERGRKFWRSDEDKIIAENYGKLSSYEIASLLPKRTQSAVRGRIDKLSLDGNAYSVVSKCNRKFYWDFDFFKVPNPINSYWAGFLAADGSIGNKVVRRIRLAISSKDKGHLERFCRDLNFSGTIKEYKNSKSGYSTTFSCVEVCLTGTDDTIFHLKHNFGVVPRKTFILKPPANLNEENSLAYIIGYLDGDGFISLGGEGRGQIGFLGTLEVLSWIKGIMDVVAPSKRRGSLALIHPVKTIFEYKISGTRVSRFGIYSAHLQVSRLRRKWEPLFKFVNKKDYNVTYDCYSF
ncbi:MAG TPA: hypothetical protein ENI23_13425 [bacterium]|nr:hypothetical protein [bacterium]